jgi:hypothetical protein
VVNTRPKHVVCYFGGHQHPSRSSAIPASPYTCGLT